MDETMTVEQALALAFQGAAEGAQYNWREYREGLSVILTAHRAGHWISATLYDNSQIEWQTSNGDHIWQFINPAADLFDLDLIGTTSGVVWWPADDLVNLY